MGGGTPCRSQLVARTCRATAARAPPLLRVTASNTLLAVVETLANRDKTSPDGELRLARIADALAQEPVEVETARRRERVTLLALLSVLNISKLGMICVFGPTWNARCSRQSSEKYLLSFRSQFGPDRCRSAPGR